MTNENTYSQRHVTYFIYPRFKISHFDIEKRKIHKNLFFASSVNDEKRSTPKIFFNDSKTTFDNSFKF